MFKNTLYSKVSEDNFFILWKGFLIFYVFFSLLQRFMIFKNIKSSAFWQLWHTFLWKIFVLVFSNVRLKIKYLRIWSWETIFNKLFLSQDKLLHNIVHQLFIYILISELHRLLYTPGTSGTTFSRQNLKNNKYLHWRIYL